MTFCVVWSTIMLLWIAQAKHLPSLEHLETVFEILCSQESSLLPVRSWNCQATDGWLQRMLSYCPPNRSLCHIINKWAKLQLNGMLSHPQEEIKLLGSTVQGPLYVTHLTALQKKKKKPQFPRQGCSPRGWRTITRQRASEAGICEPSQLLPERALKKWGKVQLVVLLSS